MSAPIKKKLRNANGSLNKSYLDGLGKDYFIKSNFIRSEIEKGDAKNIRKLNEKTQKQIKNATTSLKKNMLKSIADKEKKDIEKKANEYRKKLKDLRDKYNKLRDKGVGIEYTKKGNIVWKDLLLQKDRKKMLKDMVIMSDTNVSKEYLDKLIKRGEKSEKAFKKAIQNKRYKKTPPFSTKKSAVNKGVKVEYVYPYDELDGEFNVYDTMEINVKRVINNTRWRHPNAPFNIRIGTRRPNEVYNPVVQMSEKGNDDKAFSLPMTANHTIDEVLDGFEEKFDIALEKYEEDDDEFIFKNIMIYYLIQPNTISGAGGHKTLTQASNVWMISDTSSSTNCFYRSISFIRLMRDLNGGDIEKAKEILLEDREGYKETSPKLSQRINERSKSMKKRLESKTKKTTTEEDIQNWVDFVGKRKTTRCVVKIYNNVFGLDRTIKPSITDGKEIVYEIWCISHHFVPLVRWYDLPNIIDICKMKVLRDTKKEEEEELKDENKVIDKKMAREIIDEEHFLKWCLEKYNEEMDMDTDDKEEQKKLVKFKSLYKYLYCNDKDKVRNQLIAKNNRIAAYDIEATGNGNGNNFKSYRISLVWNELDSNGNRINMNSTNSGMRIKSFGGRNCIKDFFDFIYKNRAEFSSFTFYAHNGGKFDLLLLLNEYVLYNVDKWRIDEDSLIVLNGAYLNLELLSIGSLEGGGDPPTIRFRDSLRLLPMSLDKLGIDFNVPHKKQGTDLAINFDEINLDNCFGDKKDLGSKPFKTLDFKIELSQRVYCDYDTICLLECLNIFNKDIYEAMNIDMTGCLTGASLSKQNFFKNYYSKAHIPIYHMSKEYDTFCRNGYMGGRCEAHYIGEFNKKCYYYDFTSLYPDVGRKRLPYGKPNRLERSRIGVWNDRYKNGGKLPLIIGMMKVRVRTTDFDALPIHSIKMEGKLLFPHFKEWIELTLWANEFNYAHSLNIYEYELIDAIHFGEQCSIRRNEKETFWDEGVLSGFFTEAVEKKALAKKQKKPALAQSYKIVANSGYGFWGLNANGDDGYGRDGMEIMKVDDTSFWEMVAKGEVNNVGTIGDYTLIRTTKPMPVKDFNVSIAAAIASEARIKIHKFMKAVKDVGGTLLYCDTDSCICDIKLCDYKKLKEEFCWDGTGEDLGSMKNEAEEKLEKYFKSKYGKENYMSYMDKQKEIDGGEYSFDKGIIAGCKQYCLRKETFEGGVIEAEASKGCKKKLDYSDFHHLLYGSKMEEQRKYEEDIKERRGEDWVVPSGNRIYERQIQFRSGLIDHIKEGNGCDVRIITLDKSMRVNYDKGSVAGVIGTDGVCATGIVEPLII